MLKAISTHLHVRERLHSGILERLAEGGVAAIELYALRAHFDYTNPQQVREAASFFRSHEGVALRSMHAPIMADGELSFDAPLLNIAGRDRKDRIEAMDEIKRAIEVAEVIPFPFLVLHIGGFETHFDEHTFEGALTSIEHLRAFARPLGISLLLETIPNDFSTPENLMKLIQTLHYDDIGICLDLGHVHLTVGVEAAFDTLKPLIRSVHVHDNHGVKDEHLWPGEGTIDFPRTMELLRTAPQVPALVLELNAHPEGHPDFAKYVHGKMLETWSMLGV
jgi:sugar phosphate isomerase/epimerase